MPPLRPPGERRAPPADPLPPDRAAPSVASLPPDLRAIAERIGVARTERVMACLARRLGSVVAVAESVRRRHNASAIIRSCEVFGIHEVQLITAGFRVAPGASRHSERWVDLRTFETSAQSIADLKDRGFHLYVADLADDAYTPETLPLDAPIALVFGSEFTGVSAEARAAATGTVRIPMYGLTQSLNVSVSAGILLRAVSERVRALHGPDLAPEVQAAFVADWLREEDAARRGWIHRTNPVDHSSASSSSSSASSSSDGSGGP